MAGWASACRYMGEMLDVRKVRCKEAVAIAAQRATQAHDMYVCASELSLVAAGSRGYPSRRVETKVLSESYAASCSL